MIRSKGDSAMSARVRKVIGAKWLRWLIVARVRWRVPI